MTAASINPAARAIEKLSNVPSSMYSVRRRSPLETSPNRKTDFAVIRKPTPDIFPVITKTTINKRSRYPIHLPPDGSPEISGMSFSHFLKKRSMNIDAGIVTMENANMDVQSFVEARTAVTDATNAGEAQKNSIQITAMTAR